MQTFEDPQSDRVLNCLSLEVTNTPLTEVTHTVVHPALLDHADADPAPGGEEALLGQQRLAQLQHSQPYQASGTVHSIGMTCAVPFNMYCRSRNTVL